MEECDFSLDDVFTEKQHLTLSVKEIIWQISQALKHLSSTKTVYRNINPRNILISKIQKSPKYIPARIKLPDFSIARRIEEGKIDVTNSGSASTRTKADYTAPEVDAKSRYSEKADIYSAGLVFYHLHTGHHPFGSSAKERKINMLLGNEVDFTKISDRSARHLIEKMLKVDPAERIAIDEILEHVYFWEATKVLEFIRKLTDGLEPPVPNKTPNSFSASLDNGIHDILPGALQVPGQPDWSTNLEPEIYDLIFKIKKKFALSQEPYVMASVCWLLRAIRNKVSTKWINQGRTI
jgi:serine/threonine protein kinase